MTLRPVTQLHTQGPGRTDGHTNDGMPGDCFRAALASLLGLRVDEVPHFVLYLSWWEETRRWLQSRGQDLAYAQHGDDMHQRWCASEPSTPVVVSGPSPRGDFWHAAVGLVDGTVLWDPHPSRAGLRGVEEFFVLVRPYGHLRPRYALP